jgi:hypothetical protein
MKISKSKAKPAAKKSGAKKIPFGGARGAKVVAGGGGGKPGVAR